MHFWSGDIVAIYEVETRERGCPHVACGTVNQWKSAIGEFEIELFRRPLMT